MLRPRSLVEQWRVLTACIAANKIIIMQAANTGLTGGSTPAGDDYDRDIVIINTMHIAKLYGIEEGRQGSIGALIRAINSILALDTRPSSRSGGSEANAQYAFHETADQTRTKSPEGRGRWSLGNWIH